jgi:DNA-binding beta-propeller fold protein YncE
MRKIFTPVFILSLILFESCDPDRIKGPKENAASFREVGEITLEGGETAAEISAFDPKTKKLFVTNATKPAIDVIDLSDPTNPIFLEDLRFSGGGVNSVSVKDGLLAAAVEAEDKTSPGKVFVWHTDQLHDEPVIVPVGSLPDMVAFSDDGKFIVTANEGESSEDNLVDPNGSVSIIEVKKNFQVTTIDFAPFENQLAS